MPVEFPGYDYGRMRKLAGREKALTKKRLYWLLDWSVRFGLSHNERDELKRIQRQLAEG